MRVLAMLSVVLGVIVLAGALINDQEWPSYLGCRVRAGFGLAGA